MADVLALAFDEMGWHYRHFERVAEISSALDAQTFDLLVLDWSLPDGNADSVIRLARERFGWDLPILVESVSDDEEQIVAALRTGADDYVVKPLRIAEVQARINALLRRRRADSASSLAIGRCRIDLARNTAFLDDAPLELGAIEYRLLCYFVQHAGELLSRERLLIDVWQRSANVDTRTVDAHVGRLRRKLQSDSKNGLEIVTLRGFGYRLETAD